MTVSALQESMLIMMAGLPGTGKSTLAEALAEALPATVLNKDRIRAALFDSVDYSSEQDDVCLEIMFLIAAYLLRTRPHTTLILDGRTFSRRYQIELVERFAREQRLNLRILECVCSPSTARARLEHDQARRSHPAANRTYELYSTVRAHFEPIREPKLVVDTDQDLRYCLVLCMAYLAGTDGSARPDAANH